MSRKGISRSFLFFQGGLPFRFPFQHDPVNGYGPVFRVSVDTLHAIVTDFFRIQITAVAFPASDAFPVI